MKSQNNSRDNVVYCNSIEDDEDEEICRICTNPGDSENPLRQPCACSGSIKFVHQDCLLQWLKYSNARRCEVCRYPFSFSPVYAVREDEDPVPFDDLVGMQLGPVVHLVKFAFAVLASNVNILGAVIILPFSIGRIILHFMCWCSAATTATPMFLTFSVAGLPVFTNSSSQTAGEDGLRSQCCVGKPLVDSSSRPSDATVLAIGYMFLVSVVFLYLGIVAMLSCVKGQAVITGKLYGITHIANTITSLVRQYVKTMMHFIMSMVRVAFLLVVELGVFPLICGWWLDACTFRMIGKILSLMAEFSSLTSSLIHWIVGIIYLLQIGVYAFGMWDVGSQKLLTLKCIHLLVNY
ncbi:hypothetical protein MKX03_003669 [Papaver bracteatum]|nr:hypothetical protein MKX03_003669 [Papaver bracteatum]